MEYIQSLTNRAKIMIIVLSIFLVSLTIGLLAFGVNSTGQKGDMVEYNPLHSVTSDMVMSPRGGGEPE
jgi:hypothetical protein